MGLQIITRIWKQYLEKYCGVCLAYTVYERGGVQILYLEVSCQNREHFIIQNRVVPNCGQSATFVAFSKQFLIQNKRKEKEETYMYTGVYSAKIVEMTSRVTMVTFKLHSGVLLGGRILEWGGDFVTGINLLQLEVGL